MEAGEAQLTRERGMVEDGIGCEICFGGEPEAAWEGTKGLEWGKRLVDSSHFGVSIRGCDACGQRFVVVFSERIDWADGRDPQAWLVVPISEPEAKALEGLGEPEIEPAITAITPKRRCLVVDHPSDGPLQARWSRGPNVIMMHD